MGDIFIRSYCIAKMLPSKEINLFHAGILPNNTFFAAFAPFKSIADINFFKLYAAAAMRSCLRANDWPIVYTFLIRLKHGKVPSTGSTVEERKRIIRLPLGVHIFSLA